MDTPDRSKTGGTPISRFEDSPVFNFIDSLSPIQPVRSIDSIHNVQAYQSLNFASISSIFTSPHVNPQKESRFSNRNPYTELPEHAICPGDKDEDTNAIRLSRCTSVPQETCSITCSLNEATVDPPDDPSTVSCNLPQHMQFDAGSPNHNTTPHVGLKTDIKLDLGHAPIELLHLVQNGPDKRKSLFASEAVIPGDHQPDESKDEVVGCDWENLISDNADDLLIFDPLVEAEASRGLDEELGDNDANPCKYFLLNFAEHIKGSQKTQADVFSGPCVITEDPHLNCGGFVGKEDETDHTPQILPGSQSQVALSEQIQGKTNETSDYVPLGYKVDSQQLRGMRRRCLVFEGAGASKRNAHNDSNFRTSISITSRSRMASDDHQSKSGITSLPRVLPGIGLHLNALASTKDRLVTQDTLPSGRRLISMPCSIGSFSASTPGQKSQIKLLSVEKDLICTSDEVQEPQVPHDDSSAATVPESAEELCPSSPKKKRRKLDIGGEGETCKRCSCKKSKCLKLYCECFAAGVYCSEPCACQGCFNKPIHEETVLSTRKQIESRNPLAFAPKVIRASDTGQEVAEDSNKTPSSARHKRGCNCKKSSCLKKYCECYQGGVGCSISCRCEGCKNTFGRKIGIMPIGTEEIEMGGEGTDASEKEEERPDDYQQNAKNHEHSSENVPITPSNACRPLVKMHCFSSAKPPRPSTISTGYPSRLYTSQALLKSDILIPRHKFENYDDAGLDDDTPDILKVGSPSSTMKTSSPNGKRVSPPHNGVGFSPSRKGGRKLILKSIPSFPSLSSDVHNVTLGSIQ
ncbi:protein tesmin/TSO1-like CXC 2 isoform X1 [Typha angustifolia]|uniref:protein tesmin/TSO1-like CXC 2 isoform X1 n=1 Tax=Typha angustifolia TaxID=59011 RepID=UPI003C2E91FF